jgi:hypothetical protein
LAGQVSPPSGAEKEEDQQVVAPQLLWRATLALSLLFLLVLSIGLPSRFGLPVVALTIATPAATAVPTVYATPTARPAMAILPTPSNTPTITPTPVPQRYRVANTGGDGAAVRESPSKAGRLLAGWPDNTILTEAGPDAQGDGVSWKQVRDPKGNVGYTQAQYLIAVPAGG